MAAALTPDVAAVACAAPVTDALKRVDGDRVVGPVEREGLVTLRTPYVIRRAALDEALRLHPEAGSEDPVALLVATGHTVRLYDRAPRSSPMAASAAAKVRLSTETPHTA